MVMKNMYYPEAETGRAFSFVGNSNILIIGIIFIVIVTLVVYISC